MPSREISFQTRPRLLRKLPALCLAALGLGVSGELFASERSVAATGKLLLEIPAMEEFVTEAPGLEELVADMERRLRGARPARWGEHLEGICDRRPAENRGDGDEEKIVALTFDACGSKRSGDYDKKLISFLIEQEIPATLFVSSRWIGAHEDEFLELALNPLFEAGSHGVNHRPLSTTGRGAWGVRGTNDVREIVEEVELGARGIEALTGRKPRWFRSGTAFYDDLAVRIVRELGYGIAGFRVNGDRGGTASAAEVKRALLSVRAGDIVICHMNRPGSGTNEGVRQAVPLLLKRGFRFVRLSELMPIFPAR
jgi:peptidoglycan/xylan/chitin deacetylase (PgdA/CDA1 family)